MSVNVLTRMIARLLPRVRLTPSVVDPWDCLAAVQVDGMLLDTSSRLPFHGRTVHAHAGLVDDHGDAVETTDTNIDNNNIAVSASVIAPLSNVLTVWPRLDKFKVHTDHEPAIDANDADAHDIKVAREWTVLGCICKLTTSVGSASIAAENFSRCHCHCFLMSLISRTSQCVVFLTPSDTFTVSGV